MMRYIVDHWHGRHPVSRAFWINFAALRVLLQAVQPLFQSPYLDDPALALLTTTGFAFVAHFIIFPWQVVGVIRSGSQHLRNYGSMAIVWGMQLGLLLSTWAVLWSLLSAWYSLLPEEELFSTRMDREHASKYSLTLDEKGETIVFKGLVELGSSKRFAAMMRETTGVKRLILQSDGGNIYEARGIARLVKAHRLTTVVHNDCSSACTTIFIAGERRLISKTSRLGFHQYRLDANYPIPNVDPEKEQQKERQFYQSQSVKNEFLDRIFTAGAENIWYPSTSELVDGGVVHALIAD